MRKAAIFVCLVLVGCGPSAPDRPTWEADVRPVVMANCARCHGYPAANGAPSTFRLDVYDSDVTNGRFMLGAAAMARFMCARVHLRGDMPPRDASMSERARDILARWADCTLEQPPQTLPERGSNPDNAAPELSFSLGNGRPDTSLEVAYNVTDAERDQVIGSLFLREVTVRDAGCKNASAAPIKIALHNGNGRASFDTGTLCSGMYTLSAELSDGGPGRLVTQDLGTVQVDHFFDNVAPFVELVSRFGGVGGIKEPLREDILNPDLGPIEVRLEAHDGDGDYDLALMVCALQGDKRVAVTPGGCDADFPASPPAGTTIAAPADNNLAAQKTVVVEAAALAMLDGISKVGEPPRTVRFEVRVRDGRGAERRVVSPYLILSKLSLASTNLRFTTGGTEGGGGRSIVGHCTACHGTGANTPRDLRMDLQLYDDIATRKALLYRRVVLQREMPPPSTDLLLNDQTIGDIITEQERVEYGTWLLAGAPEPIVIHAPTFAEFGMVAMGATGMRTFTVTSEDPGATGTLAVAIGNMDRNGGTFMDAASYSIVAETCTGKTLPLARGTTCTIMVRVAPARVTNDLIAVLSVTTASHSAEVYLSTDSQP